MKKINRLLPLGGELLLLILLLFGLIHEVATASGQSESRINGAFQYLPIVARKPLGPPLILQFSANVAVADPGDTIELSWRTQDAITNTLYHLLPSGQLGSWWNVTPAGTMTYTVPASTRNQERFILYAMNGKFPYDSAMVSITLTCPDEWFFSPAPDICPQDAALISTGAEQAFEHGVMVWVAGQDGIYVLFDDNVVSPRWDFYTDDWNEGDPIDDPTIVPPAGFYQPVRGFGLVWREQPGVRDRLGWALAPEVEFETAVQYTSYSKYNSTYLRALDGNVWWLGPERGSWQKIIVSP